MLKIEEASRSTNIFECPLRDSYKHVADENILRRVQEEQFLLASKYESIRARAQRYSDLNESVVVVKGKDLSFVIRGLKLGI